MKKNLSIEVEFLCGEKFDKACYQAKELCQQLDIAYVKFDFNGVKVSVGQKMNLTQGELKAKIHKELNKESGKRFLVLNS